MFHGTLLSIIAGVLTGVIVDIAFYIRKHVNGYQGPINYSPLVLIGTAVFGGIIGAAIAFAGFPLSALGVPIGIISYVMIIGLITTLIRYLSPI